MNRMSTCLWFDRHGEDAFKLYSSAFANTKEIGRSLYSESGAAMSGNKAGDLMMLEVKIEDLHTLLLNGGPIFKHSPSFSLFVSCQNEKEIKNLWDRLSEGGQVRMGLDKYPWAEMYGWTADKYGVEWQMSISPRKEKIVPSFLFVDELFGRGEEAIKHYTSVFKDSQVNEMVKDEKTKSIMYSEFTLNGQKVSLMEGAGKHGHKFSCAGSLVINVETQAEIDHYYDRLAEGGSKDPCGWVTDKFGVSWQVTPTMMSKVMTDPAKCERVMAAMGSMKKLDLAVLKAAADGR